MLNEKEYQTNEYKIYLNENTPYFDSLQDFEERLDGMDILEQIEWIENGSYGCGHCLALQKAVNSLNSRTNNQARIGNVVLKSLYGAEFKKWNKLSPNIQNKINKAIDAWLSNDHDFAIQCII